jgi:hypothetical protein
LGFFWAASSDERTPLRERAILCDREGQQFAGAYAQRDAMAGISARNHHSTMKRMRAEKWNGTCAECDRTSPGRGEWHLGEPRMETAHALLHALQYSVRFALAYIDAFQIIRLAEN